MLVPPKTHLQSKMSCVVMSDASKLALPISLALIWFVVAVSGDFYTDFTVNWGDGRAVISEDGSSLSLSLDNTSGSGFESNKEYLFGNIDMQIKLVPGNSAGTVTAYYLSSKGDTHDEIDFEFLGNLSGDPYTLHTNVFTQGKGSREQQFSLWFDPTTDFHTYSVLWTSQLIRFSVDGLSIREFKNLEYLGVAFPTNQPMKIYSSLWNADQWATRGGLIKTDWTQAPFTASYRNFTYTDATSFASQDLNSAEEGRLQWVRETHMIYNYCTDPNRISQGLPVECTTTN